MKKGHAVIDDGQPIYSRSHDFQTPKRRKLDLTKSGSPLLPPGTALNFQVRSGKGPLDRNTKKTQKKKYEKREIRGVNDGRIRLSFKTVGEKTYRLGFGDC